MTWARFDDDLLTNDKYLGASVEAKLLWHTSIIYCAKNLTDGFVRSPSIAALGRLAGVGDVEPIRAELIECRLWDEAEGGINVHDYLDYNPCKADVLALKAARAEAGALGGKHKASNSLAIAKQTPSKDVAKSYPVPGPVPGPVPIPGSVPKGTSALDALFSAPPQTAVEAPTVKPEKKPKEYPEDSIPYRLTSLFIERLLSGDSGAKVPKSGSALHGKWVHEMAGILRRRDPDVVEAVIRWCFAPGCWWESRISAVSGFVRNFDTMYRQMRAPARPAYNGNGSVNRGDSGRSTRKTAALEFDCDKGVFLNDA